MGNNAGDECEGLSGVHWAYLQPQEETGMEGVDRGMDRSAYRKEEKKYLQLQSINVL